ncbi:MAG: hypothetical protein AAGF36_14335 [Pseudomonadota bacterium]
MYLHKFCETSYHPKNCSTLRIGTLNEFRTTQNAELRDEGEATFDLKIVFRDGTVVERLWLNKIFRGILYMGHPEEKIPEYYEFFKEFPEGSVKGNLSSFSFKPVSRSHNAVSGHIELNFEEANWHVFCMSLAEKDFTSPFEGYDDCWNFPVEEIESFKQALTDDFLPDLRQSHFTNESLKKVTSLGSNAKGLVIEDGPVEYTDRTRYIKQQSDLSLAEYIELVRKAPFTKPIKYAHEREYRFVLKTVVGNWALCPTDEPVLCRNENMRKVFFRGQS